MYIHVIVVRSRSRFKNETFEYKVYRQYISEDLYNVLIDELVFSLEVAPKTKVFPVYTVPIAPAIYDHVTN